MISYSSHVIVKHPQHYTLQHCNSPCSGPLRECCRNRCRWVKKRYLTCILICFGLAIATIQRVSMSILLTEMVRVPRENNTTEFCPTYDVRQEEKGKREHMFEWDMMTQGDILAGFYYGYFITQLPGVVMVHLYGGKDILGGMIFFSSLCSIMSPFAVQEGPYYLVGIRVIMGLLQYIHLLLLSYLLVMETLFTGTSSTHASFHHHQGPIFPAITSVIAHWAPRGEKDRLSSISNAGIPLGLIMGNILPGLILQIFPSWEQVFYIFGGIGWMWWLCWCWFVSPSPGTHPFIEEEEANYILDSLRSESQMEGRIPWSDMLSSKDFIVATLANLGHEAGLFYIVTELPIYLSNVIHLSTFMNGVVSGLPWIGMWLGSITFGKLSLCLINKEIMKTKNVRKLLGAISNILPACLWATVTLVGCDVTLVGLIVSASMFFVGAVFSSVRSSFLDISPHFAGMAMSVAAAIAAFTGFAVPHLVHWLIGEGSQASSWQLSFFILCGFVGLSVIPYLLFIDAKILPWNTIPSYSGASSIIVLGRNQLEARSSLS